MLSVAFGVAVAVGNTIGSGILRTPGEIASLLPSPFWFIGVWVLGGAYAFLSALSIAELGTLIPRAGGQYAFARRAFGDYAGFVVGYSDWLSTCGSTAAAALVIGEYFPFAPIKVTAVAITVAFALLQLRGVRLSGRVQEATSLLKTLAFAALVIACFLFGSASPAASAPHSFRSLGLLLALQSVIFTYDGWTGVIYFSEEVKDPAREVPRSLFLSVGLIAGIYLLVNFALLRAVPLPEIAGAPLAVGVAASRIFGSLGNTVIRALTLLSMIAAIHAFHLMATRVVYGMARDRLFFRQAMEVNRAGTPAAALLVSALIAVGFILSGTFDQVVAVLSFFFVANYAVSFSALLWLRAREPHLERPFRVPLYPVITLITLLGSIAFLIASIWGDQRNSAFALLLLLATLPIFIWLRKRSPAPAEDRGRS